MKKRQGRPQSKKRKLRRQFEPEDFQDIDWSEHDAFMSERFARILKNVDWPTASTSPTQERSLARTKSKPKAERPPPGLDVTAQEWHHVRQAYANGLEREEAERWHAKQAPKARRDLTRFLKFWDRLSPATKANLAEPGEDADFYERKATEYRIVVRARQAIGFWKARRGRPQPYGYLEAASALAGIWKSRGRRARPGRLYLDKTPAKAGNKVYDPNALVTFVSQALRSLDPAIKGDIRAQRLAKSAVDALYHEGRL
jgi:hypothetical protein